MTDLLKPNPMHPPISAPGCSIAAGTLLCLVAVLAPRASAEQNATADWPEWRGPGRANRSAATGLLPQWPTGGPPLRWTVTGLGEGITAPAVAAGQVYTLGYHDDSEYLIALEALSGETRWTARVGSFLDAKARFGYPLMRWLSPRVPTVDDARIYTLTATGNLMCRRTKDGAFLWHRNYPVDFGAPARGWGFCDYPLVDCGNLICLPGGPDATLVALDKWTGELVWKTVIAGARASRAHAATVRTTAGGIPHYIVFLDDGLAGIAADDGRVLWRYGGTVGRSANSYTPIVYEDFVFSANGYGASMGLVKLAPEGDGLAAVEQYRRKFTFHAFQDSTVLVGHHVYAFQGPGQPVCIDVRTGELAWGPVNTNASRRTALTCADGHLYLRRSDGLMTLVEASPHAYLEKGTFSIPQPEEVSGVTFPVVAGGRLYLRDNNRLLCYDVRADAVSHSPAPKRLAVTWNPTPARPDTLPALRTGSDRLPDAIFVPTPEDVVVQMLELAAPTARSLLYDLGSGDGRMVMAAARNHGCRAVGVEIDPELVEQSRAAVRAESLDHLVRIDHADLFTVDFSEADVVVVYLPTNLLARLGPQLEKLKPGARIVSHQFPIPGVRPQTMQDLISKDGDRHRVFLWTAPLHVPPAAPAESAARGDRENR